MGVKEILESQVQGRGKIWRGKWIRELEMGTIKCMCKVEFRCQNECCKENWSKA